MSERKAGWYWCRTKQSDDWCAVEWAGGKWVVGLIDAQADVLEAGPRIPTPDEPWQCVPTHTPTIDMTEAGMRHVMRGQDYERAQACWRAMLAAAPKPEDG